MKTWKENEAFRILVYVFVIFFSVFISAILISEKMSPPPKTKFIGYACLKLDLINIPFS